MRAFFGVVAVSLFALVSGAASAAQVDVAKMKAAKQAADQFLALAKGSETSGRVPRQSDPKVKPLLDKVFNNAALGSETLPLGESGKIGELLANGNRVGMAYFLAGTGTTEPDKLASDPQALQRADRNVTEFAPEIGHWFDFQIGIQNAIAESVLVFLSSASKEVLERPNVKSGLGDVRGGLARSLSGIFQTMSAEGLNDAWRRDRLAALAVIAPKASKLLTPEDASALQSQATELAETVRDPTVQAGLKKLAATIAPAGNR